MPVAVAIYGLEARGWKFADMNGTSGWLLIEVSEVFDADDLSPGTRYSLRIDAEALAEIFPSERIIPVVGWWAQTSGGIGAGASADLYW